MRTCKPWGPESTAPWKWKQHIQKQGQQWLPWADLLDSDFSKEACAVTEAHLSTVSLPQRLLQTAEEKSEGRYLGPVGWQASRCAEYEFAMTTPAKTRIPRKDSNWFSLDRSHLQTTQLVGRGVTALYECGCLELCSSTCWWWESGEDITNAGSNCLFVPVKACFRNFNYLLTCSWLKNGTLFIPLENGKPLV